jgi:DNA-binding NarL/FixJ family response regulator
MIAGEYCFLVDDDSIFVEGINEMMRNHFREKNIGFEICQGVDGIKNLISDMNNITLLLAVVDLWFIDKNTLVPNENEGYEILKLLRKTWPDCYIVFHSAHINGRVHTRLDDYKNITIIEKPISALTLLDTIDDILRGINR